MHIDATPPQGDVPTQADVRTQATMLVQADALAQAIVPPRANVSAHGDYEVVAKHMISTCACGSARPTK